MLFSKRDKNVTRHKQFLSILNSRLAIIKSFQAPVMNATIRCILNASSKFSIEFYFHPIVNFGMFVPFLRRVIFPLRVSFPINVRIVSFHDFSPLLWQLHYSIGVELLSLARKRNVPIRKIFKICNLPKKASSHRWSIFLTSEISDDLSV